LRDRGRFTRGANAPRSLFGAGRQAQRGKQLRVEQVAGHLGDQVGVDQPVEEARLEQVRVEQLAEPRAGLRVVELGVRGDAEQHVGLVVRDAGEGAAAVEAAALQPGEGVGGGQAAALVGVVEGASQPGDGGEDGLGVVVGGGHGGPRVKVNKLTLSESVACDPGRVKRDG
jgi:hypothetical protein